jgi:predicted nucleic acid-binding protein
MSVLYAESSAVLAWLLGESGSSEVIRQIDDADTVASSVLTLLEIERALIRAEQHSVLRAADGQKLRGMIKSAARSWVLMEVSEDVLREAARVFPAEPVRTLDALHLATALIFVRAFPELQMLTLDRRISANAQALGIG